MATCFRLHLETRLRCHWRWFMLLLGHARAELLSAPWPLLVPCGLSELAYRETLASKSIRLHRWALWRPSRNRWGHVKPPGP
jgi:hypothetical protein